LPGDGGLKAEGAPQDMITAALLQGLYGATIVRAGDDRTPVFLPI
jgi:hypothetical protein